MNDPRDSDSPFGVLEFLAWDHARFGHHSRPEDLEKTTALMREAGVGFVRFDFLWEDLEPAPGQFNFDKYDRLVDGIRRAGLQIEGILAYNPQWAGKTWNQAPDPIAYARYAQAVVNHFKDRVRHWEIWHEPDSPDFWQPHDQMQSYVALLRYVTPILKSVDNTCVIHLGGMSRTLPMGLRNVYQKGGKDYFDVVNIHPFANPLVPRALEAIQYLHGIVRRIMEEQGDGKKPMWFTEIGCPGMQDPTASANWWLGSNPDEQAQARWVKTVYGEMLGWKNVEKIFWCFFRDTHNHFQSGSDYDGLIRNDFSKKPSFEAYRNIAARKQTVS